MAVLLPNWKRTIYFLVKHNIDMAKKAKTEDIVEDKLEEGTEAATEQQELKEEVSAEEKLETQLNEEKDRYLRLFAEFENFKKRTAKERIDLFKTASHDLMLALLPILDDFDRAYSEISKSKEKDLLKGVELISVKLKDTLKSKGLKEMEVKAGDVFNPDNHEAVSQIPAPSDDLKGKIIDVIEKGYLLGDKIIRFPKVVLGQQ